MLVYFCEITSGYAVFCLLLGSLVDSSLRQFSEASGVFHLPLSSSTSAVVRAGWFCWLRYTSSCVLRRGDSTGAVLV